MGEKTDRWEPSPGGEWEREGSGWVRVGATRKDVEAYRDRLPRAVGIIANHPTTIELADGRVQITLTAEEWRQIREAAK